MDGKSGRILVVGAAGQHGGTGAYVVRALRESGRQVRALVRSADSRAEHLAALGAEVAIGDLHDRRTLLAPLQDVDAAYFAYPVAAGIVEAAANFSSAARSAGLKRVVVMSMGVSHPDSPSHLGRAQWLAEDILAAGGLDCLHLRIAAFFFENIELLHGSEILDEGVIRNSFADVKVAWMAGEDAGRLAVAALLHPERAAGKTAIHPTGSEKLSHAEIGEILQRRLGKPVRHETVSAEAWRIRLLARSPKDSRINADMARHISTLGERVRQSLPSNDIFETLTGRRPISFEEYLEAHGFQSLPLL